MLKGMLIDKNQFDGIRKLISAHHHIYDNIPTITMLAEPVADTFDVMALHMLMKFVSEITADASLDAVCQS